MLGLTDIILKHKRFSGAVLIVAIVGIGGGAAWLLTGGRQPEPASPEPTASAAAPEIRSDLGAAGSASSGPSGWVVSPSPTAAPKSSSPSPTSSPVPVPAGNDGTGGATPNSPPSAPTNLHTTSVTSTQVILAFAAGTDANGIARHELLRDGIVIVNSISQSATISVTDTTVVVGHSYVYTVRAVDTLGATGPASNSVNVTVPVPDTTPPSAPTNFHVVSNQPGSVVLAWNGSTDNITAAADLWYILSSSSGGGYYVWTQSNPHEAITLDSGQTYEMYIRAIDEANNESALVGPLIFTAQ